MAYFAHTSKNGVFRIKGDKDVEISVFGIQIVSGSSSQLGFYKIYCSYMILKGKIGSINEVFPEKLIVKIKGIEEWFEKKSVGYSHADGKISISLEDRVVENLLSTDHFTIDIVCYVNFNFNYRENIVKEIVTIVISFKCKTTFLEAIKWEEKLRQVFSLFFRKQLRIEEVSFFIPEEDKEFFYAHSDPRDFYKGEIKHRNEAIIRYSDSILFNELLKIFLNAEPRLSKLMETYFLMELNHSLYNENAFLTWVFELDSFIKKGKQKNISRKEAMRGFSKNLTLKLDEKYDPLLEELFKKWLSISNERAKFYGESLQSRLVMYFSHRKFFKDLISINPDGFFKKIVKTRNHLVHPKLNLHEDVIPNKDMNLYQSKLRLLMYCIILIELGMDESLMVERLISNTSPIFTPLSS